MSTIKVTDLKLHLNQNNADMIGAADSHRVFGDGDGDNDETSGVPGLQEINLLLQEVYISECDSKLLLWAQAKTSIKIKQCISSIVKFIGLLAKLSMLEDSPELTEKLKSLPTHTQLVFNLHELENLAQLKTNEVN